MNAPSDRREVLIPLAAAPGQMGAVCRVLADGDPPPPQPDRLDPAIVELLQCGLYQAGDQAQAAVRVVLGRRRLPVALTVANPGDLNNGLREENSASAELGLALVLALHRSQAATLKVLASGALDTSSGNSRVPVKPVHYLGEKFALVAQHFRQPGSARPPEWFFTPTHDPDGVAVLKRYAAEIAALATLGVTVLPVADVSSALERLAALRPARPPRHRWLQAGIAAGLVLLLGLGSGWAFMERALPLKFVAKALPDGRVEVTPFRTTRTLQPLAVCKAADGLPLFQAGDYLAFRVQTAAAETGLDQWLGYAAVLVSIGSQSGVTVMAAEATPDPARLQAGRPLEGLLAVLGQDETHLVAVLVRRGRAFDQAALERQLRAQLEPLRAEEVVSSARALLPTLAPGVVMYLFRSVEGVGRCV